VTDSGGVKGRVLVIDDDPMVGRMLVAHIRAAGYEATLTDDPEQFIQLAREWKPTHVFVDLVMGDTDGLTVLSRLAEAEVDAAVVIQSGMGGRVLDAARQVAQANGLPYAGVLNKPFTRADVAEVLAHSIDAPVRPDPTPVELDDWSPAQFEDELRGAASSGALGVAYQPKVTCHEGRLVGFEALARWTHPGIGAIPPISFVPRAESMGLVSVVTDAVARAAAEWFAGRAPNGRERLCINISASELVTSDLHGRLTAICSAAGVSPERIVLEVTETSAMGDTTVSLEVLTRLRLDGFQLSIDDFGTGYSSMTQLASMPFTEVKVDRSFVQNLGNSLPAEVMVRSMLQLSRGLGLECTAEGVETALALDVLSRLGCDFAQGYHIARPMPGSEVEGWLSANV
jgi:EAL domain-containing protein (putative c-di-GMP-specific phosphodiesterase class I)/ActR/RegA family two-component response regulator